MTVVTVYSRPGCHLCDEAIDEIVAIHGEGREFELHEVDIESDELLLRRMLEKIPVVEEQDVVVGVLAVPSDAAQDVADRLVDAGVKIIFNYSEQLLQVPPDVTVHTSSPAVDLLYALYFYLT